MANEWRALGRTLYPFTDMSMLDVFNATGSGRVVRIGRVFVFSGNYATASALFHTILLQRTSGLTVGSGYPVTPIPHDSATQELPAEVTCGTERILVSGAIFRQLLWSTDDTLPTTNVNEDWQSTLPYGEIWNAGEGDTEVQRITCRETEGFHIKIGTVTPTAAPVDAEIEFTNEAS